MRKEEKTGIVYAQYIPVTTATYINGIKVWDIRWWANWLCKLNLWLHPAKRKWIDEFRDKKVCVPAGAFQTASF